MYGEPPAEGYGRAGRYVAQRTGYRAFIPSPLPPDPPVRLEGPLLSVLSDADRALGRLDGSIRTLPNAELFVLMYVRKEAVLSSQIEGTQSSLRDVLAAEAEVYSPDRPRDVHEVINYVRAMNHGLRRLGSLPLSVRLIREIHGVLVEGVRGGQSSPGELRRSQNWIGPAGCTLASAMFVPPPPHEVHQAMGDLERFLHSGCELPLLVRIGLAHAQFETIHPFLDGNGRVGRLLVTFLLCEGGVLSSPVLYLSHYFRRNRQEYYERLQAVRDDGDWEAWLTFFLAGVASVSSESADTARRILALREEHRGIVTERFGRSAANGHRALEYLYDHPVVSVTQIQAATGTTYQAANGLVRRFTEAGLLTELTGRTRNRRYEYTDYVSLFADDDGGDAAR